MRTSDILLYHPTLIKLLWIILVFIVSALLLRRRILHISALLSLFLYMLYFLSIIRFEQEWEDSSIRMHTIFYQGHREEALQIARNLLTIARQNFSAESPRVVESVHHVGWLLIHVNRATEAEPFLNESLAGYQLLDKTLPNDDPLVCGHGIGNEKSLLGYVYQQTNRLDLAAQYYREALTHYKKRCPNFPEYQTEMTEALSKISLK